MKNLIVLLLLPLILISCVHSVSQEIKPQLLQRKISSDGADQIESHTFEAEAGKFKSHISWTVDPFPPNNDVARALVEFEPDNSPNNACQSIRFIQIARVEKSLGVDYEWDHFEKNRKIMRTESSPGVEPGYFVDHLSDRCKKGQPCSIFFRDHWPNADESQDGYKQSASHIKKASLIDYPFGWTEFEKISAEACAYCQSSKKYYGCVRWSARWPLMGPRELGFTSYSEKPSRTFAEALRRFTEFYSKNTQ